MNDLMRHLKNKRQSAFLLLSLLFICLLFGGCGSSDALTYEECQKMIIENKEPHFYCTVLEVRDNTLLVLADEGKENRSYCDQITVSLYQTGKDGDRTAVPVFTGGDMGEDGTLVENYAFSAGDRLCVCFDGDVMETYPAQLSHVSFILIETTAENNSDADNTSDSNADSDPNTAGSDSNNTSGTNATDLPAFAENGLTNNTAYAAESDTALWEMNEASTVNYVMEHEKSAASDAYTPYAPTVALDPENNTFSFTTSVLSSYLACGTYTTERSSEAAQAAGCSVIRMRTNDGLHTYCFAVIDEDTLQFLQEYSDETDNYDERIELPVADGALFIKTEPK